MVPLVVTAYTLWWLAEKVANVPLVRLVAPHVPVLRQLGEEPATAILTLAIVAVLLVGAAWVMRTALGAVLESKLDGAFNQVPGFRVVYNASKLAIETAVDEEVELQSPAKVEMWNDARLTAFRTGREAPDGRTTVYVPASPIIVTGFVTEVPEDRVVDTDESVENALIRVISAGFADASAVDGPNEPTRIGAAGANAGPDDETGA